MSDMLPPAGRCRAPLSLEDVVGAAVTLAQAQGIDGVTMRSVAAELDVTPMALYYHVHNKQELVALVAVAATRGTVPLALGDEDWEEALREYLTSRWSKFRDYRGLGAYAISLPNLGTEPETYSGGVKFFEDAGFPSDLARLAWPYAITYIHGRLSVDANLDRESAHAGGMDGIPAREHVAFGIDAIIAGLRAILEAAGHHGRRPGATDGPSAT